MKPEDFDLFAVLLKQRSGLVLTREKSYLLESRLVPVARKWSLSSLEDMAQLVRARRDEALMTDITDAMMSGDSQFFRDRIVFDFFQQDVLPRLCASRSPKKHLRIWSAATAAGQEAYTLAMICAEEADRLKGWQVDIVATDLSRDFIARAEKGIYSQLEIQRGLPAPLLVKYFHHHGEDWQASPSLRAMVKFQVANLLTDFTALGSFDVIFCRNALGGLDVPIQKRAVDMMCGLLQLDGCLIIGCDEEVTGISEKLKPAEKRIPGVFFL